MSKYHGRKRIVIAQKMDLRPVKAYQTQRPAKEQFHSRKLLSAKWMWGIFIGVALLSFVFFISGVTSPTGSVVGTPGNAITSAAVVGNAPQDAQDTQEDLQGQIDTLSKEVVDLKAEVRMLKEEFVKMRIQQKKK